MLTPADMLVTYFLQRGSTFNLLYLMYFINSKINTGLYQVKNTPCYSFNSCKPFFIQRIAAT